ncbi:MAG TPA: tautomerase family protein [Ramlibacter sp.]|nr:tautomerase family protein [Ramlibacter sp.]
MPLVQISLIEGRDPAAVTECARQVARVIHESLGAPLQTIRVTVHELPSSHWIIGDRSRAEIDAEAAVAAHHQGKTAPQP